MAQHFPNAQGLGAARRALRDEGRLDEARLAAIGQPIGQHIGRSWQRCLDRDAGRLPGPEPLPRSDFDLRREAALRLIETAQPELETLAEQMAHTRSVLILTDAHGLILEENGSTDFLERAGRIALQPGVDWSEPQCGTNAIGTALVERAALEVRGAEHFLEAHRFLSCAAAPIMSSRGEVLGVLDVSGDAAELHQHALALVKLASEQIEHRLIHEAARGHRLLRFHAKAPMLGTPREALVLIDDERIVGVNSIALRNLGREWVEVLDQPLDRFFDDCWRNLGERPTTLHRLDGTALAGALLEPARIPWRAAAAPIAPIGPWSATPAVPRADAVRPATARPSRPAPAAQPAEVFAPDATLRPLLERAVRVLDAGSAVLLQGETGVGKDVFAGLLHRRSTRADGPLVAVNCAALPDTLIESELFGYAEGAFTGAHRRGQSGRVRDADGGVLFLDEIGDMPLALQSRLLRVLQERAVTPLGSSRSTPVDFALVCATHRDLPAMVAAGQFRADLYYRLADYVVPLPALRDRPDVRDVIERLFAQAGADRRGLRLSAAAFDELSARPWPGNLRELASVMRTLVALAEPSATIGCDQLPPRAPSLAVGTAPSALTAAPGRSEEAAAAGRAVRDQSANASEPEALARGLKDLTAQAIDRALLAADGRVSVAARALGVNRSTVYRHLAQRRGGCRSTG